MRRVSADRSPAFLLHCSLRLRDFIEIAISSLELSHEAVDIFVFVWYNENGDGNADTASGTE